MHLLLSYVGEGQKASIKNNVHARLCIPVGERIGNIFSIYTVKMIDLIIIEFLDIIIVLSFLCQIQSLLLIQIILSRLKYI